VWPTTPREFVTLTTYYEEPDGTGYIVSKSVEDDYCPATGDYVRGKIVLIGTYVRTAGQIARVLSSMPDACLPACLTLYAQAIR
jgi:hypothetical protein